MSCKTCFLSILLLLAWLMSCSGEELKSGPLGPVEHTAASPSTSTGVPTDPLAVGYLNLHKRHPDADEGVDEFHQYSIISSLERTEEIKSFLVSFRALTDRVRTQLSEAELAAIGITEGDLHIIGFHNIPLVIEGTLLKQDYRIKQLEYELELLKSKQTESGTSEVEEAKMAYEQATRDFQSFWDNKLPTD